MFAAENSNARALAAYLQENPEVQVSILAWSKEEGRLLERLGPTKSSVLLTLRLMTGQDKNVLEDLKFLQSSLILYVAIKIAHIPGCAETLASAELLAPVPPQIPAGMLKSVYEMRLVLLDATMQAGKGLFEQHKQIIRDTFPDLLVDHEKPGFDMNFALELYQWLDKAAVLVSILCAQSPQMLEEQLAQWRDVFPAPVTTGDEESDSDESAQFQGPNF